MKCDKCANEATVHEVVIKGGKQHEKHLCEQCAKGDGLPVQTHAPLTSLLTQYITQQTDAAATIATGVAPASAQATCSACGLSFVQFRQSGLLGCAVCYEAFEQQLGPLLARAHEGGTHHVGKSPRSAERAAAVKSAVSAPASENAAASSSPVRAANSGDIEARNAQIAALRKQLAEAVSAEQYEKAAKIRDELARMGGAAASAVKDAPTKRPRKKDKEGDA